MRGWVWLLLAPLLLCYSVDGQQVVLQLKNGDRITGQVLSEGTNGVVLTTAFSERLFIAGDLIARRDSLPAASTPPSPQATNNPAVTKAEQVRPVVPATGIASELVVTNKPSAAQAPGGGGKPASPPPKAPPPKPPEPSMFHKFLSEWRGEAQLGANLAFSTTDREAFTGLIKLTHNHAFHNERSMRNILEYDVSYGITENVLSDNRMDGTWKTEYDLSKRFLLYNAIRAGYDEVRKIDFQYDFGPGLGYKWVVQTNFVFKTELGGNYQEQFFADENNTSVYSLRLAEDMWWQITPKIRWDEKVEFFPEVSDLSNYRVRLETNLSYLLRQNLTLTLNVIDLYDTAVPTGVSENDLQIRSLLGLKF